MAELFTREAIDHGDLDIWGSFEKAQNNRSIGLNSSYLFLSGGTLYISKGKIGLNDDSDIGTIDISADKSISVAGLTASCWAKIELSKSGTSITLDKTSIGGATNPATLPASFTGAYNGIKGGYYIDATKRCVGLVWINAGGVVEGIINDQGNGNYSGYSTSDDTTDLKYYFDVTANNDKYSALNGNLASEYSAQTGAFTAYGPRRGNRIIYTVTTGASSFNATIEAAANWAGKRIKIIKVDTGAGIVTAIRTGAETFQGATAFPMRMQYNFIELESDGTNIYVVDSLSTLDSAALATNQVQTLAHEIGIVPRRHDTSMLCISADSSYVVGDEVEIIADQTSTGYRMIIKDATNFITQIANSTIVMFDKGAISNINVTANKWKFRIRYSI